MRRRRRAQTARAAKAISWSGFGSPEAKRGEDQGDVSVVVEDTDVPPPPLEKDDSPSVLPALRPVSALPFPRIDTPPHSPPVSRLRPVSRATTVGRPSSAYSGVMDDDELPPPSPMLPDFYAALMSPDAMTHARNSVVTVRGDDFGPPSPALRPPMPSP